MARTKEMSTKTAEDFMKFCNSMSINYEEFVDVVMGSHRTLQQNAFGVMLKCIQKWAELHNGQWYDHRNEATVLLCKKIVDTFGDEMYLPTI